MTLRISPNLPLVVSLGVALVSAFYFAALWWRHGRTPATVGWRLEFADSSPVPNVVEPPASARGEWIPPTAQSRGPDWIFEVFTPPEIFHDSTSARFTVQRPATPAEGLLEPETGVQLLAVRPEPFRLGLLGHLGKAGEVRAVFGNRLTGEVFLAGDGARLESQGVEITRIEVSIGPLEEGEDTGARGRRATAVIWDLASGREVRLVEGREGRTGAHVASEAGMPSP